MTTETAKLALMWYLRWGLHYPLVATECDIGNYRADILAIRKGMAVEIEIKRFRYEIAQDLKRKKEKHQSYLHDSWYKCIRPHKFYFALPRQDKYVPGYVSEIPDPYGLILIYGLYECRTIKRAKYLTKDDKYLGTLRRKIEERLTSENIDLRLKVREMRIREC